MLPACPQAGVMVRVAGKTSQWEHAQILAVQRWGAVRCELRLRQLKTKQFCSLLVPIQKHNTQLPLHHQ